ncbi:hypothetical protein ILUMI_24448 [Ignelater luminosus]|uniref:Uncharacterized protein n=1 Tax=Ignelater luminosus TaxID=2038154 RepID=A0A8K0CA88_IGNLU|nr:hypothetical protein ILUMI_24448 [Ignelater luminosus]
MEGISKVNDATDQLVLNMSGDSHHNIRDIHNQEEKDSLCLREIETIRSIVHDVYITEQGRPTLAGILEKVKASRLTVKKGMKFRATTHYADIEDKYDHIAVELYEIIKQHKPSHRKYVFDALLHRHDHVQLNPIEKIWEIVKNWVVANNITPKLDVKRLGVKEFAARTAEEWASVSRHSDIALNICNELIR